MDCNGAQEFWGVMEMFGKLRWFRRDVHMSKRITLCGQRWGEGAS